MESSVIPWYCYPKTIKIFSVILIAKLEQRCVRRKQRPPLLLAVGKQPGRCGCGADSAAPDCHIGAAVRGLAAPRGRGGYCDNNSRSLAESGPAGPPRPSDPKECLAALAALAAEFPEAPQRRQRHGVGWGGVRAWVDSLARG